MGSFNRNQSNPPVSPAQIQPVQINPQNQFPKKSNNKIWVFVIILVLILRDVILCVCDS